MSTFLNETQLMRLAPSIFAQGGSEHTSSRYGFIPTIDCVRGLEKAGFYPVKAMQSKTRIAGREVHAKHIMRFRREGVNEVGGMFPEIVMVNSHDGSTSYQLRAGIYRLVCMNGMIVGDDVFGRRVSHQGDVVTQVVEAANDLIEIAPLSVRKAEDWKQIELRPEAKQVFAETAAMLKWDQESVAIHPGKLLEPRRMADKKDDLWTTFNVIQENMIRGGVRYRNENQQRQSTREVKSVSENVRLNTALWTLTERMAELVK